MPAKAVLLYSGGLDSLLAAKVLMDQGVEVTALHCLLPFTPPDFNAENLHAEKLARQIGLKVVYYRCETDYINMLRKPKHGYGKRMNPCIDCKIFFIKQAGLLMKEIGADFVATGEVVGQRPMSQLKNTLKHIINETELDGRLVRPLSAKILDPTLPETTGLIDREKLLNLSGRGRSAQIELAEKFGIAEYQSPAGGCLLTDSFIAARVKDLLKRNDKADSADMFLLTLGRHYRYNKKMKFIVGRNETENLELEKYRNKADLFLTPEFKGPALYVSGEADDEAVEFLASVILRYGKPEGDNRIFVYKGNELITEKFPAEKAGDDILISMRI